MGEYRILTYIFVLETYIYFLLQGRMVHITYLYIAP
nr:MAG TPA: hypothetical protein [Caudoviricetes sp.]